jgi:hypothetical protein
MRIGAHAISARQTFAVIEANGAVWFGRGRVARRLVSEALLALGPEAGIVFRPGIQWIGQNNCLRSTLQGNKWGLVYNRVRSTSAIAQTSVSRRSQFCR